MSKFSDDGNFTIRGISPDMMKWIKKQAELEQRTISAMIRMLIKKAMET